MLQLANFANYGKKFDKAEIHLSLLSCLLFGEICPKNSLEIATKLAVFSMNLSLQILQNLTFFPTNYLKPFKPRLC